MNGLTIILDKPLATKPQNKKPIPQAKMSAQGKQPDLPKTKKNDSEDEEDDDKDVIKLPGAYNPSDYAHLNITPEIEDLFRYITRWLLISFYWFNSWILLDINQLQLS